MTASSESAGMFNAISNGVNLMIVSVNRASEQVLQSSMRMSTAIHDRLKNYGDVISKQFSGGQTRTSAEDALMADTHIRFLNALRKNEPSKYNELVSIAQMVQEAPMDVKLATVAFYFGDPNAVQVAYIAERAEIRLKIKELQSKNQPIPLEYKSFVEEEAPLSEEEAAVNLSLTKLQYF